jgi:hypothetical protein
MQGVTRRCQTPTWQDPPQSTAGTRKPILTGMQEVSGSSPLSSTQVRDTFRTVNR